MTIMANDLKTRGVTVLDEAFKQDEEVIISVRGKSKYVVMDLEHYNYLRECELEAALIETRKEIEDCHEQRDRCHDVVGLAAADDILGLVQNQTAHQQNEKP